MLLGARGYDAVGLDSAARLFETHQSAPYDVVLLDVMMAGLDGVSACRIFKARSEGFVPVILVTARDAPEARVEGLRAGADDYVPKPFVDEEVLARVASMLRIKQAYEQVRASRDRFAELAMVDALTGLFNVRYLEQRLREEWKRAERQHEPLALAMLDLDRFKAINDRYGHEAGNDALREVSARIAASVRETDVVARYGGEEFVVLLPSTRAGGALVVAERIRSAVASRRVGVGGVELEITVSVGVGLYPSRGVTTRDALVASADHALYRAKDEGRNRTCVAQELLYELRPNGEDGPPRSR